MLITPDLKGRVYFKNGKYHWVVKAPNGNTMGKGEEIRLAPAFQNAHDLVHATQIWMMLGRGDLLAQTYKLECDFVPRNRTGF
jgi:hypothetical protein